MMEDKLYPRVPAGTRSRATQKDIDAAKARKKIEYLKEDRKIFDDLNLNFNDYFVKGDSNE
tara:strand:- start:449 stop:631 length:183 start_codon:yes stop_codon:yes gene_type:complete